MKISVYIPYYNSAETINQVIEAVKNQNLRAYEILIVDDGSGVKVKEILKSNNIAVIEHEENLGLSQARNTAFKNLKTDFVAALDADCVPEKDWLQKLYSSLNGSSVGIAGAGGRLIEKYCATPADQWRSMFMKQEWGKIRTFPSFLYGSNTIYRKDQIEEVDYYSPSLKTNYEDVDISLKLKKKGFSFVYEPKAVARHYKKDTVSSVLNSYWNWQFPPKYNLGRYDSLENLKDQINLNLSYTFQSLNKLFSQNKMELLPIGFLLFFSHTLLDVRKFIALKKEAPDPGYKYLRKGLLDLIHSEFHSRWSESELEKELSHTKGEENLLSDSPIDRKELTDFIFAKAKYFIDASSPVMKHIKPNIKRPVAEPS